MSSYKDKNLFDENGELVYMVSLLDVAFLKWSEEAATLLDKVMLETKPKKLSSRSLSRMTEEAGYPVSHQTINSMRKGETSEVTPENLMGVCRALNMRMTFFLSGPTLVLGPEKNN